MEEKNNTIKINLITMIVLIVIVIVIVIGIISVILNKSKSSKENEVAEQKTSQFENKAENTTSSYTEVDTDTNTDIDFSFEFLKMENEEENIVYSPLSIKYALKMLSDGANGNTKTQIDRVIGNANLTKYNNIDNVLSLANALYLRDVYGRFVKDDYKNTLVNKYNAEIKYDGFENANNINKWIEDKTFGQIKNMVQDEIVTNPDTQMLLINALAIDMAWKDEFEAEDTNGGTFYLIDGNTINATMMHKQTKSDNISYYKDDDITALAMDLEEYEDEQMEFVAIMPNDNLSDYIENFSTNDYENITDNLTLASESNEGLNITIPRFSFDYNLKLKQDLKNLGITDAFEPGADFSNMADTTLCVDEALHKSNIDFSEKGVKAAAATVIVMMEYAVAVSEDEPVEIKIDKPFMYFIRDKKTGEIWFVGTVYEPDSWENDSDDYQYR